LRPHVIRAVFARNFLGYFSNPAGYVFITLFVLVSSWAAFCLPAFFANNLDNLDTLNQWMPYLLLFFIPAITMTAWAEERRQGTEELLLTLPARDVEVVLGKFLAALGIYTAALAFLALGHGSVLKALGQPDLGVLATTYLGYWLMGALLVAIGLVASMLSTNATVAFILGGVFAAVPVFANLLAPLVAAPAGLFGPSAADRTRRLIESLSVPAQFNDFGSGVVPLAGVFYFVSLTVGLLYVNMVLLGRRHWAGGEKSRGLWAHALVRVLALAVALASLDVLAGRWLNSRLDASEERLNTLSHESAALIRQIPKDRPVYIQAYYSPDVPREFVETKADLLNLLRECAAIGGDRIRLNLIETERFSPEARDAEKRFGITARRVMTSDEARQSSQEVFLGVAFSSGPEQVVVPFFDRGLPVEYEMIRSIRVVSRTARKKVGILNTDAKLLGGFDFQSMGQNSEWQVVTELKKQYEVTSVGADEPIPGNLDALLVAQPSSLTQKQIDNLTAYIRKGGAALLMVDPLPYFDPSISPTEPRRPPGGMFGGAPPPEPKGDLQPLLSLLGVNWPVTQIVWNPYNPLPQLELPPEIVFVGRNSGASEPFGRDVVSSGLQDVVMLFPGVLRPGGVPGLEFEPLLRSSDLGGTLLYEEIVQRSFFGVTLNRNRSYLPDRTSHILAARIKGKLAPEPEKPDDKAKDKPKDPAKGAEARVIVVADLDVISDQFFELRKRPREDMDFLDFDNVTFVLNCVDSLAGDDAFIPLRKKRPRHRTLEAVEAQSKAYVKRSQDEARAAEDEAKKQLAEAQKRLDAKVAEVQKDSKLDERTKDITLQQLQDVENRRLDVQKANIEDEKRKKIEESRAVKEQAIRSIQSRIKLAAILLPPLPALLLGCVVFAVRAGRENRGASPNRLA
jgi:ABC-2 type transport system permease protein